jgi:hypothetical protein
MPFRYGLELDNVAPCDNVGAFSICPKKSHMYALPCIMNLLGQHCSSASCSALSELGEYYG